MTSEQWVCVTVAAAKDVVTLWGCTKSNNYVPKRLLRRGYLSAVPAHVNAVPRQPYLYFLVDVYFIDCKLIHM